MSPFSEATDAREAAALLVKLMAANGDRESLIDGAVARVVELGATEDEAVTDLTFELIGIARQRSLFARRR